MVAKVPLDLRVELQHATILSAIGYIPSKRVRLPIDILAALRFCVFPEDKFPAIYLTVIRRLQSLPSFVTLVL
jgi:hypothetical protein